MARPTLRLVSTQPLRVSGRSFRKFERVRVRAFFKGTRRVRNARTFSTGTFVVSFGSTDYDPCTSALAVTARGSSGDRAVVKRPLTQCPPP
jgi:hypothetical protein